MTRFDGLLRAGLRSNGAAEEHLDADQISAFLANRDSGRASVMAHASRCAECREVLFLATGELPPNEPSFLAPLWRWAWIPVAAAVCTIAIGLALFPNHAPRSRRPIVAVAVPPKPPGAEASAALQPQRIVIKPLEKKVASDAALKEVQPEQLSLPIPVDQVQNAQHNQQQAPQMSEARTVLPGFQGFVADKTVHPASILATRTSQWTVSSGIPEQSADSGATWRPILIDASVRFQAIASLSNEVWAGGSAGALFHSMDLGEHWQRVSVTDGDNVLTSEIVKVQVVTRQQIQLLTVNGEQWVSEDGGNAWKRE